MEYIYICTYHCWFFYFVLMVLKKIFFAVILLTFGFITKTRAQINKYSAEEIVKKTIGLKKINDTRNFESTTYNKLIITANPESIKGHIDSVFVVKRGKKVLKEIDSSDYAFKKVISKQHLYQTEKISKFKTLNGQNKEIILATRMAGFKEPIYEYFALQLQPQSVYEEKYSLVEKEYFSPISKRGFIKYNYELKDSLILENRKVFKITFEPKTESKKNKLYGVLFIDSEKFSIVKLELKVSGLLKVYSLHEFDFNKELNNWIPKKNSLTIKKGNSKSPIKILGETITFEGTDPKFNPENKKYASDFIEIKSNTTYFEPRFNQISNLKQKETEIEINERAITKKDNLWYTYFNDSIDVRSNPTYVSLDSLVEKRKWENKIKIGRKVINGYYPIGFFDVDLRYLIRYNNYEGFRVGIGGVTNEKLSKNYRIEGYGAYGTKDGFFKIFLSNAYKFGKQTETWFGISYKDDLSEIANTNFEIDKRVFKIYDPRPFNISTFYNHETWKAFLETKIIPKTQSIFQVTHSFIEPKFDYFFENRGILYDDFYSTVFTASLQWNPFSKFMQTPSGKIEVEKKYPKFTFQFSQSLDGIWNNYFDFGKFEFRFDYQKKFNSNHKISFLAETGYAYGDLPITHLYNHSPNNLNKNKILKRITFAGRDSFETMFYNEFFSNKHAFFQLEHQFPKLEISKRINPIFSLVSRYGIGTLDNKEQHKNFYFKTLDKGFLESGFELNQIYRGIGFTATYRYGANHLPQFEDNIAIKLSVQINLGFDN